MNKVLIYLGKDNSLQGSLIPVFGKTTFETVAQRTMLTDFTFASICHMYQPSDVFPLLKHFLLERPTCKLSYKYLASKIVRC